MSEYARRGMRRRRCNGRCRMRREDRGSRCLQGSRRMKHVAECLFSDPEKAARKCSNPERQSAQNDGPRDPRLSRVITTAKHRMRERRMLTLRITRNAVIASNMDGSRQ